MLLNISFENFRSFKGKATFSMVAEASKAKEQNVFTAPMARVDGIEDVRLLKTATVYGANASGKSNLIRGVSDILQFVCDPTISAGEKLNIYTPFLFDKNSSELPISFSIEFILNEVKYKYELTYDRDKVIHEVLTYWPSGKPAILFQRSVEKDNSELIHKVKLGASNKNREEEVFANQAALSKFGKDIPDRNIVQVFVYLRAIEVINPLDLSRSRRLRDEVSLKINNTPELLEKMVELLKFADTGLTDISLKQDEQKLNIIERHPRLIAAPIFIVRAMHPVFENGLPAFEVASLPLHEESNGVRTLYSFGGKMLESLENGSILWVDELETSLHPYLSKLLVQLFQNERINKKNAQLIFTTHDTNLLDRTMFRRDQIWFAQKDHYGVTELYSLQDFSDVREDTAFDKWYLAGKFGGIPNIQSLENLFKVADETE
jgi:hypothetical protein